MEYKITKTNPEGTKTRWSVQRVSKTNQPIGKAEIFSTEDAAKRYVAGKQSTVEESRMSSIMKGILSESGEPVSVIYIDGKPSVKYTNVDDAREAVAMMKKKHPKKNIEIKSEIRETEAKKGADGKRYAGTVNGKDKCIPVKEGRGDVHIGALVYPKWDQTGEPFEVVRIIDDMTVLVRDDHGNEEEMYDRDLISAMNEAAKKKVGEYSCYAEVTDPDEDDELMSVLVRYDVDTDRYDPEGHARQEEMITNVSVYDDSGQEDLTRWIIPARDPNIDPRILNAIFDDMEERAENSYRHDDDEDNYRPRDVDESGYGQSQRRYKAKPAGQIDEASMYDVVGPLIREFNLEHGGSERWSHIVPLHSKASAKRWRRGDGSYYTDPNSIEAFDQSNPEQRQLQSEFYDWLIQKPGVKKAGEVSGEFRSDRYAEAAKYKGVIFVKRGYATQYFTPSKLRNSSVWNKKNDNNQEKAPKQQQTTWEPLSDSSIMKGLTS